MRILGAGDNVVDRYVDLGTLYPGGNALNVAVFAARFGAESAYLGVVGDDEAGQLVRRSLIEEGVGIAHLVVGDGPNAHADVVLRDGDREFVGSSRGIALFEPTEEQLGAMTEYDLVHSGYAGSLLPFVPRMAERTLVSFDFGSGTAVADAAATLPHLYLAAFSAGRAGDAEAEEIARQAVALGARHALVTRGSEGALLAGPFGVVSRPALRVPVVDTLGAGDAFIASTLVGLLGEEDPGAVLEAAAERAAQVCTHHGAFGYGTAYRAKAEREVTGA